MKNPLLFLSFLKYCLIGEGRNMRFWQALAGWSGRFIFQGRQPYEYKRVNDTFYLEGKK